MLGAEADMTLYAVDRGQAGAALDAALTECARLEAIFSLYQPDSALSRLNRDGRLDAAPFELLELVSQALALSAASGGTFDPTIQPLWRLLADHFARPGADPAGPSPAELAAIRPLIGHRNVVLEGRSIAFQRPGMQLTLNGIAQGYISDRVATLLESRGFAHALVNLGEARAIDRRADGQSWRIGIPASDAHRRMTAEVDLASGAVATSAATGFLFDATGRFNHLIDPTSCRCADPHGSITIVADTATIADGLSTLGAVLPARELVPHLRRFGARAYVASTDQPGAWLA